MGNFENLRRSSCYAAANKNGEPACAQHFPLVCKKKKAENNVFGIVFAYY
jgi:hypothetical protein